MREAALWVSGAALAFVATAGAFLLLASLATGSSERSLRPNPRSSGTGPALELRLDGDQLASLRALPGQELDVTVGNTGRKDLSNVNLTLVVSSENTALSGLRYYRETLDELASGTFVTVHFYLDLSARETTAASSPAAVPETPRNLLEGRAPTPEGPAVSIGVVR